MNQSSTTNAVHLPNIVRTLLINGYAIDSFDRPAPSTFLIHVHTRDSLGGESKSVLLFAKAASKGLTDRLEKQASQANSTAIVISIGQPLKIPKNICQYPITHFYELLGGEVRTDRIFSTDLKAFMDKLGHNVLPRSLAGKPDDLLEAYAEECLEFLLECPVRRYGQERRFEPLPDGLALGREGMNVYFDAKAYVRFFHPSADDIRRFASYVKDFNARYSKYVGRISIFLVISGSFSDDAAAVRDKGNDMLAQCGTPMVFVKAADLAEAVHLAKDSGHARGGVNWHNVLVPDIFQLSKLAKELEKVRKDSIIQ
jgi:hypothetical protein